MSISKSPNLTEKPTRQFPVTSQQDAIQEILVLGGLKDYTCTKPEDWPLQNHLVIFGLGTGVKTREFCGNQIILNILPDEDGGFSIKDGGAEKTVPKTNTEFTPEKWWERESIYTFLFGAQNAYFQGLLLLVSEKVVVFFPRAAT